MNSQQYNLTSKMRDAMATIPIEGINTPLPTRAWVNRQTMFNNAQAKELRGAAGMHFPPILFAPGMVDNPAGYLKRTDMPTVSVQHSLSNNHTQQSPKF